MSYTEATNVFKAPPNLKKIYMAENHLILIFRGLVKSKLNRTPNSIFAGNWTVFLLGIWTKRLLKFQNHVEIDNTIG